ncbi:uncharacterized protein F4822DRAFT_239729 [Hypoxylon trugodes]|uniref:uncharacterized protein n=1 Tax=Hypoxylon trugodes TaxID=326681 RepID=UPI0021A0810E|nr:uncharacterized protein F4822DRAFT_239729 [Hypoxylon trugodes]KAI1388245.1 hypothetical protein F4822DRAFT_239729 [Hypoxylon trugodes]
MPKVLTQSHQQKPPTTGNLWHCSRGFLGYGVPINGLKNETLLNIAQGQPNFEMIKSICIENGRPSRYLNDLAHRFALCSDKMEVYYFHETNPSADLVDTQAPHQRRVDDPRAIGREKQIWVPRNHSELVKISSRNDEVYSMTHMALSNIINDGL